MVVYWVTSVADWWVVLAEGRYWLVPATAGGWELRRPYRGHVAALRPVRVETARVALSLVGAA